MTWFAASNKVVIVYAELKKMFEKHIFMESKTALHLLENFLKSLIQLSEWKLKSLLSGSTCFAALNICNLKK